LKQLLHMNQSQLNAGLSAAGLLASVAPQQRPISPNMNPLPFVGMQPFTPVPVKALPYVQNVYSIPPPPFSHDADGTRYSEQTMVSVKQNAVSPVASPSGYVRRQA